MIQLDLHVHSIFSLCGIHTVLELLARAKELGMKGFAVTDHGTTLGGRLNNPFFERFRSPDPSVRVLKGVECNVLDHQGKIDAPRGFLKFIDVVLLGLHPNTAKGLGKEAYTDMLIAAIESNPCVDIISHPNDPTYPVEYKRLAAAAKGRGIALELNNSKVAYARTAPETASELIAACMSEGCLMAVNSDTHAIHELGDDSAVRPLLLAAGFPEELIVNSTEETALAFIEKRRANKNIDA